MSSQLTIYLLLGLLNPSLTPCLTMSSLPREDEFYIESCENIIKPPPPTSCPPLDPYRSITGQCNNVDNQTLGAATTPFRRLLPQVVRFLCFVCLFVDLPWNRFLTVHKFVGISWSASALKLPPFKTNLCAQEMHVQIVLLMTAPNLRHVTTSSWNVKRSLRR